MCGIIGYLGKKQVVPLLINGLERLEYRGYDSAGLCVTEYGKLSLVKRRGKVAELTKDPLLVKMRSSLGIAHTRWATHGEPNEVNAHPHFDCKGEIAIVHNGIIENYHILKEKLEKEGHKIISRTDSEILAHLIEKYYQGNLENAVIETLKEIEGTFALVAIHCNEDKIVAARKGSPLILGIGDDELFVTSDVSAIASSVRKVVYIEDNKVTIVTPGKYLIKDFQGNEVYAKVHELHLSLDSIEKNGYKHFMLKEIFEQPQSIENTLRGRIKDDKVELSLNINFNDVKRIIIVACGTSRHAALVGKDLIEKIAGIPVEVDYASEFRYRNPILKEGDAVIAISQSGETADTLAALNEAKNKKIPTIGIVNVVGSSIAREVGSVIYLHAGPEIGVASTKAFTCQISALILLALKIKQELGGKLDERLLSQLKNIPEMIKEILLNADELLEIAKNYKDSDHMLYLGRGLQFPVAIEGALKLKEISYIHAEGYPSAELKHGPIALVDEKMPVVFIAPRDGTYEKNLSNMQEVKARSGKIIAIVNDEDPEVLELSKSVFIVPKVKDELSALLTIIPLQLLAYYIADLRGIDVDKPRNLAKSVTVE